jgi:hypothetical protein
MIKGDFNNFRLEAMTNSNEREVENGVEILWTFETKCKMT